MKLLGITAAVLAVVAPAFAYSKTYFLTYDSFYDDGHTSLADVTCSHGEHGLLTHGYTTFDSLPSYPYIGAAPQISGTDSKYCGSCWEITHTDSYGASTSVNFTAVDAGEDGSDDFSISLEGMDYLTHGLAREIGLVSIIVTRKSPKACHLD
ncbi:Cerato-platanin [Boletus reticuloceps]|uniref:Cerato-platanin n=1 Tax=Boletus reticuloceps TaxID=495285 RepID=A0A8I3AAK0_9AGAM|nr:Cerato-platanin [Boletus reticuloceps]